MQQKPASKRPKAAKGNSISPIAGHGSGVAAAVAEATATALSGD